MERKTCTSDGCNSPRVGRGLCQKHYDAAKHRGTLPPLTRITICTVAGCKIAPKAHGLCATHHDRRKAGWTDWDTRPVQKKRKLPSGDLGSYEEWERCLLYNYGLKKGDYEKLLADQGGGCAICGEQCHTGRRLSVDHDHNCCPSNAKSCGECIRGLLCGHCNQGLGKFKDSPDLLINATAYLAAYEY